MARVMGLYHTRSAYCGPTHLLELSSAPTGTPAQLAALMTSVMAEAKRRRAGLLAPKLANVVYENGTMSLPFFRVFDLRTLSTEMQVVEENFLHHRTRANCSHHGPLVDVLDISLLNLTAPDTSGDTKLLCNRLQVQGLKLPTQPQCLRYCL